MKKCSKCKMSNCEGNKFCYKCGSGEFKFPKCLKCGERIDIHYSFCVSCGTKIEKE